MQRWANFLIYLYRTFLSGWLGGNCRFEPSCSVYAEEAFQKLPPSKAFFLVVRRILSCRPFGRHGYDPVPVTAHEVQYDV